MRDEAPAAIHFRRPIHPILLHLPELCFFGALLTDITYARSYDMQWANFSVWLITAGLLLGGLGAVAALFDLATHRLVRTRGSGWLYAFGYILAWVLSLFNAFVHSRDAYTSVVPAGLTLSAIVFVLLLITRWYGRSQLYPTYSGVAN